MKTIHLTGHKVTMVDDDDYEQLNSGRWYARHHHGNVYATNGYGIQMHRVIMKCQHGDGKIVDHIDRNGLNNQKSNLRIVTVSGNARNRSPLEGKEYKGVTMTKSYANPYKASINVNYKDIYLGSFSTPEEAALAYNEAAKKYFGEHAYLNIVNKPVVPVKRVKPTNNSLGYYGVRFDKRQPHKPYIGQIVVDGKPMYLGSYPKLEDAAKAYNEAAIKYHGDKAKLNAV